MYRQTEIKRAIRSKIHATLQPRPRITVHIFALRVLYSITPTTKKLQWLPVVERIDFKILLQVLKCVQGSAPVYMYLKELCPVRKVLGICDPLAHVKRSKTS